MIIRNEGMGCFLNPPDHAEYNYSIQDGTGKDAGFMSLSYALNCDYVSSDIKNQIQRLLNKFPGKLTEEWVHSCYNYFRNCYAPDNLSRNALDCIIDSNNELPVTRHLAYLHIRSFFPDHKPRLDLISNNGNLGSWSKE